ncbi:MAG: ComEA family DNA-binding protein [Bacteroidota bacterium]
MSLYSSMQTWGFTKNELRVILLLSSTFLVGLAVRWYATTHEAHPGAVGPFDYSESDRQFAERSKRLAELALPPQTEQPKAQASLSKPESPPMLGSININTATKAQLMQLPGIGEQYAERIIIHREDFGLFASVDDLRKVKGIGKKRLEKMRPFITLE